MVRFAVVYCVLGWVALRLVLVAGVLGGCCVGCGRFAVILTVFCCVLLCVCLRLGVGLRRLAG